MGSLFVASAPGIEPLLADELRGVGVGRGREVPGGVELEAGPDALYQVSLRSGLALKVLVRLGSFPARHFNQLLKRAAELDWAAWIDPARGASVRAKCVRSKLYHSGAVADRVRQAISRALGTDCPDAESGAIEVQVRLLDDQCQISIDACGEPLSRRGYRLATGKAPLREDLARALLIASGWDRECPLYDPFSGSGTIAIEADWLARRVPPGHLRSFAFKTAPSFDEEVWRSILSAALADVRDSGPPICGSDRDAGSVKMARENARRAGAHVEFAHAALGKSPMVLEPPGTPVAVVSNPPYGRRVGERDSLRPLYQSLGEHAAALESGSRVALVIDSLAMARQTGLSLSSALMTDHGGAKVYFAVGDNRPR